MNQKMQLWNTLDRVSLEKQLLAIGHKYITISFYQYAHILDPQAFRNDLYLNWTKLDIVGRTYVAKEGINAQISVPDFNFEKCKEHLYSIEHLHGLRLNIAVDDDGKSFWVLKIKVREKIVADGITLSLIHI